MLNRFLNLARRHKDPAGGAEDLAAFPPRKRAMATTCFGQAEADACAAVVTAEVPAMPSGPDAAAQAAQPEAPAGTRPEEEPAAPADAASQHAPAATTATLEEPELAVEQMRLTIENGVLMVLGPEGDPVPPHAFGAAAAARPYTPLALPDGTTAPAFRVAAVLGAQLLGRLGAAAEGAGWILAMLRDGDGPAPAPDEALRAEEAWTSDDDAPPAPGDAEPAAHAALDEASPEPASAGIEPSAGVRLELDLEEPIAVSDADLELDFAGDGPEAARSADGPAADSLHGEPLAADESFASGDSFGSDAPFGPGEPFAFDAPFAADQVFQSDEPFGPDQPSQADGSIRSDEPFGPQALLRSEERGPFDPWVRPEQPIRSDAPVCSDEPVRAGDPIRWEPPDAAQPDAREADVNPDSMVLVVMRGVPAGASLSRGIRDEDGSWSISPIDLATVTISLAGQAEEVGETQIGDRDLTITGIAFGEDGELVAISETVPLADYLADPAPADPMPDDRAGERHEGSAPASAPTSAAERVVPLAVDPQTMAGQAFDALVVRDLPAGARLSAGAYDRAIAGWVLRPQDLSALAIVAPPDLRGDFLLTLTGIALRPGARPARALGGLSVTLA
jgi:hypothetical protein